jgi:3-carboxy-cis,cis-muconate cycloisomerase
MMMPGRTNGQHAQPIPFDHKVGLLADEIRRHVERLEGLRHRVLQVQLGGPVGTLTLRDDRGFALRKAFAEVLGLRTETASWQSSRDSIAETALWLSLIAATIEKMGWTFGNLASSDIGEVRIRGTKGKSSAMPHKNNPRDAEFTEALARLARQRALSVVETGRHEHERSGGVWIAEWMLVPEVFLLTSACLQRAVTLVQHVEPDKQRMRDNLERSRGVLASEAVMKGLAGSFDLDVAQDIVSKACHRAQLGGRHLLDELTADPRLSAIFTRQDLEAMIDGVYRDENSG